MYRALKRCKFDKEYLVGDTIPSHVVDRKRIKFLIELGLIVDLGDKEVVVEEDNSENELNDGQEKELNDGQENEIEYSTGITENNAEEVDEDDSSEEIKNDYTKSQLEAMKKEKLIDIATLYGMPVDSSMKKDELVAVVIAAQNRK